MLGGYRLYDHYTVGGGGYNGKNSQNNTKISINELNQTWLHLTL